MGTRVNQVSIESVIRVDSFDSLVSRLPLVNAPTSKNMPSTFKPIGVESRLTAPAILFVNSPCATAAAAALWLIALVRCCCCWTTKDKRTERQKHWHPRNGRRFRERRMLRRRAGYLLEILINVQHAS